MFIFSLSEFFHLSQEPLPNLQKESKANAGKANRLFLSSRGIIILFLNT
jgi:hypothetical protein